MPIGIDMTKPQDALVELGTAMAELLSEIGQYWVMAFHVAEIVRQSVRQPRTETVRTALHIQVAYVKDACYHFASLLLDRLPDGRLTRAEILRIGEHRVFALRRAGHTTYYGATDDWYLGIVVPLSGTRPRRPVIQDWMRFLTFSAQILGLALPRALRNNASC